MVSPWLAPRVAELLGCGPDRAARIAEEVSRAEVALDDIDDDPATLLAFTLLAREAFARLENAELGERCHALGDALSPLASFFEVAATHVRSGQLAPGDFPGLQQTFDAALAAMEVIRKNNSRLGKG